MANLRSAVSALQEICAQKKVEAPQYSIISDEEVGFICKLEVMNVEVFGTGRSKRDAKHMAAENALKRLRGEIPVDLSSIQIENEVDDIVPQLPLPAADMVAMLRDYCVQEEYPLPIFDLVNQYGTPNAPRFTFLCQIASIKRFGTSDSKKKAKQIAAFQMYMVIQTSPPLEKNLEVVSMKEKVECAEEERFRLFKTYRDLMDSGIKTENFGQRISDRHKRISQFYDHLKKEAFKILETEYESKKSKAYDIFDALKLVPKVQEIPSKKEQKMLFIECDCPGIDICFAGFEDEIYDEIIQYFRIMLV